jgi:hypothetical protein
MVKKASKSLASVFGSKKAQDAWKKATETAKTGGFPQYEDGRYKVQLVDVGEQESKGGDLYVVFTFKFLDGDYKGKPIQKWDNAEDFQKFEYLAKDLERLGHADISPEDVVEALKELKKEKPVLWLSLKTKDENQQKWIQNVIKQEGTNDGESEEDEDEDVVGTDDAAEETEETDDETEEAETDEEVEDAEEADEEAEEESDDEDEDEEEEEKPVKKAVKGLPEKKKKAQPEPEPEEEEEAEEEVEEEAVKIVKGMKLKVKFKGASVIGTVKRVDEVEGKIVLTLKDGRNVKVAPDAIEEVI